ncbi:MAG: hypothetical protein EBQ80_04280 [Proteobacteria bacterium]|nr:hypothetical protein [Pseudomonadota bacterium]
MRARQESMAQAERQLELQQADLSDRAGKVTLARAVALAGAWQSVWHGSKAAAVQRGSVDGVDVGLMRQLRGLGLELVMAAQVDAAAVYAGPLAVPVGSALADGLLAGENVLVAEHATGEAVVRLVADEVALGVAGVVADMREIVRGVWAEVVGGAVAAGEDVEMQQVVFCGYSKRGAVLDAVEQVVYEKVATDGQWQAVVRGADFASLRMRLPEAVIVPMAGGWEVPAGGLRLVG